MSNQFYTAGYGRRVQEAREQRGWKQKDLAERSGVVQQEISRIEAGKIKTINMENLMSLAKTLEKPPGWLLFGVENIDTLSTESFKIAALWDAATHEKQVKVAMDLMPAPRTSIESRPPA